MSKTIAYQNDPRSHDEIMLAARQMRAEYIRKLYSKLHDALFSRDAQGTTLTPQIR
ncbi:RSP_7527 family protein [Azospirillum doebereinerae]